GQAAGRGGGAGGVPAPPLRPGRRLRRARPGDVRRPGPRVPRPRRARADPRRDRGGAEGRALPRGVWRLAGSIVASVPGAGGGRRGGGPLISTTPRPSSRGGGGRVGQGGQLRGVGEDQ